MGASNKFKEMKMPKQMKKRKEYISINGRCLSKCVDTLRNLINKYGESAIVFVGSCASDVFVEFETEETDMEHILRKRSEAATEWKEFKERKAQYEKLKLEFDA